MAERNLFEEIREGLEAIRDNADTLTRHDLAAPDIKAIRDNFQLSQLQMAAFLGVKTKTLQNWEQGVRNPTASAQTLLRGGPHISDSTISVFCPSLANA
jgi:putative transcriptional regulator